MRECIVYTPEETPFCNALVAERFTDKLIGLLRHKELKPENGLLLSGCKQVHTIGMKFPIDVIFLSRDAEILYIEHGLAPGKISRYVTNAFWALELVAGTAKSRDLKIHDIITLDIQ